MAIYYYQDGADFYTFDSIADYKAGVAPIVVTAPFKVYENPIHPQLSAGHASDWFHFNHCMMQGHHAVKIKD